MSVTNYQPKNDLGCKYSYDKLENVVYLVSKEHVKNVYIDNGQAYIDGLTEAPLKLDCFNIQFNEETSLDERYKFTKTLKFSMYGYVPHKYFDDKFYAIIKSKDGTLWMVNVDFPSYVTYTFNLGNNVYETDFTFSTVSNFPTLRLASDITESAKPCVGFRVNGVKSLKLLEREYCNLDFDDNRVYTYQGEDFKVVEYLGESCTLQENFDGMKTTTTINFDIAFDAYKSSWHYNLLEFLQNLYAAIIEPKGGDNIFFCGFGFGLEPSFTVSTTSQNGESDTITITLTDASERGLHGASAYTQTGDTTVLWIYVDHAGGYQAYECVGNGQAKYLLQQELSSNSIPTGRYKALLGYENNFPNLNIIGTFTNEEIYYNQNCGVQQCTIDTNVPSIITYYAQSCYTYTASSTCDWTVSNLPSYITVYPMNGVANSAYTLTVCNTKTPTENESGMFNITSGNNTKVVNVNLIANASILNPQSVNINCLGQNVIFTYNPSCPITVTSIDSRLSYTINNSQLIVTVPRNYSIESGITWSITVKDCNNGTQTVTINQDKTYEQWVDSSDYLCDSGNSYVKQIRYTGTTSTNINTPTGEYRKGSLIQSGDTRCGSSQTMWVWDNHYYCVSGDKYKAEEQEVSTDGGTTWTKNGVTRLGEMVESSSSWCNEVVEYKWELTSLWVCGEPQYRWYPSGTTCIDYDKWEQSIKQVSYDIGTTWSNVDPPQYSATTLIEVHSEDCGYVPPTPTFDGKFKLTLSNSSVVTAACDSTSAITQNETNAYSADCAAVELGDCLTAITQYTFQGFTSITSIEIPNSITYIRYGAFSGCTSLSSATLSNSITVIPQWTFSNCTSLTSIDIPDSVTTISGYAFYNCSGLTSVVIPSGVTSITGRSVFQYCTSLTSITCLATTPPRLGYNVFDNTNNCPIYVPCDSVDVYKSAWRNLYDDRITCIEPVSTYRYKYTTYDGYLYSATCNSTSAVTSADTYVGGRQEIIVNAEIGNCVTTIDTEAFYYQDWLTAVTIPNSVTNIGNSAFYQCERLPNITIPDGVVTIGNGAFYLCSGLTSVNIPNSVTTIGQNAFNLGNPIGFTTVTIGTGVTSIGDYAFYNYYLINITVKATTPPTLGTSVFYMNSNMKIYVPMSRVEFYKVASGWSNYANYIEGKYL